MEKTIEEKKVAVFAECERLKPSQGWVWAVRFHEMYLLYKDQFKYTIFCCREGERERPLVWLNTDSHMTDGQIEVFHFLLGLSERDAVADEKARLLKRYKARIKRLRANDAETHRIQIEVKDERITALEAKNAALVAALEKIYAADNDPAIEFIAKNALAANEKGGKGE